MPETIQDYRTATEDNRDLEEIVGGASASAGEIPYQAEVTYSSAEEPTTFVFIEHDQEEAAEVTGGTNLVIGDNGQIIVRDGPDQGRVYPGLDMDWEYPGGRVGDDEMSPDNCDLFL